MITVSVSALILAAPLPLAAAQPTADAAQQNAVVRAATTDRNSTNSRLLAAAEPFETLTEQSFSASPAKRKTLVSQAEQAAANVADLLAEPTRGEMKTRLAEIKQAQRQSQPADLARASVEVYRLLVSAAHPTRTPTEVNLLDYAGFRYDADLKSSPPRWTDMKTAVEYAKEQWKSISGRVTDTGLRNEFDAAIREMDRAVANKSHEDATRAVASELQLVDRLERHFARP